MKKAYKAIGVIALTALILFLIYSRIDFSKFLENLVEVNVSLLIISVLLLIPPTFIGAYRWKVIISNFKQITLFKSLKLFLVSLSLNMVTPSRLGDFGKAFFIRDKKFNLKIGAGAGIFEKYLDLLSIITLSFIGVMIFSTDILLKIIIGGIFAILIVFSMVFLLGNLNSKGWIARYSTMLVPTKKLKSFYTEMMHFFATIKTDKSKLAGLFFLTFFMWFLHIVQAYAILLAIGLDIRFAVAMGLLPIGIIVGLIPVTIGGLGTRDSAFILLFSGIASAEIMALYGLLFSMRYFLPALVGLLFIKEIR